MVTELKVSAIENGTVIDHIPSKNVFQVIKILDLENFDNQILFGTNLESKKYGTKGIIKVRNKYFADDDINRISLVAPKATLIVIKDFQVVKKRRVEVPDTIDGIVRCFNPNCITNVENVATKFKVVSKDEVILQCHYCEKNTVKKNISFK